MRLRLRTAPVTVAVLIIVALLAVRELNLKKSKDRVLVSQNINRVLDPKNVTDTSLYVNAIFHTELAFDKVTCGKPINERYALLKSSRSFRFSTKPRYFFALDLHQSRGVIARLLNSINEAITYLGHRSCVISVVEGRSTDGTYDVLLEAQRIFKSRGVEFHLVKNDEADPKGENSDRFKVLAQLRNQALDPLLRHLPEYADDTVVIFSNDAALCVNEILELIYQHDLQKADLACPMDYSDDGLFYDIWIARGMTGDIFFEIPPSGLWENANNLFWNDEVAKRRLQANLPFQVYACWNGIVSFTAKALHEGIRFHSSGEGECLMGEPTLFCRDFWNKGFNRIMVVPVWVAYSSAGFQKVRQDKGTVEQHVLNQVPDAKEENELIVWVPEAPDKIKCLIPSMADPTWVNSTTFHPISPRV